MPQSPAKNDMRARTTASEPAALWQKACFFLAWLSVPGLFLWRLDFAIPFFSLILGGAFAAIVGFKVLALLLGLLLHRVEKPDGELADEDCPVYTVLIPLFKEPEVVVQLTDGLKALDYPKDKLDARILVEEIDHETQAALAALTLPEWIQVLVVPDGRPRTKPRACNYGLEDARGEYVVIFDAEDRPEVDQLKKAVLAFQRLPARVICLQAYLNFYNSSRNWLTRLFALDYTCWFDFYLPGLHVLKLPIPLGGTSNHFRSAALRELGAWDAHNVTEDCDLGLRMARQGFETRVLDSTTWEEAVEDLGPWIRQRSRWVKGYWQTVIAHTRQPVLALREFGLWSFLGMLLVVGGQVFSLIFNPICLGLLAWILLAGIPIFYPDSPHTIWPYRGMVALILANLGFVAAHAIGALQRRQPGLVPYALLLPVYWLLMSVGAWRGVLQYFWAPFHWDKTPHGLTPAESAKSEAYLPQRSSAGIGEKWTAAFVLFVSFVAVLLCAWYLPKALDFEDRVRHAAITLDSPAVLLEVEVEENWTQQARVLAVGLMTPDTRLTQKSCKAVAYLKVIDGDWYQMEDHFCDVRKDRVTADFDLTAAWTPVGSARPWHTDNLRRVRSFGLRLYGIDPERHDLSDVAFEFEAREPADAVEIVIEKAPQATKLYHMTEVAFTLSEAYSNPFDPDIVDMRAVLTAPDGEVRNSIAFFTQDFERHKEREEEKLKPIGLPYWAFRFTPDRVGDWSWQLVGEDHLLRRFSSESHRITVAPSDHPGYYQVDPDDPRYFSRSDGSFFYPLMMTLRSPGDTLALVDADYESPHPESGTYAMDAYLDQIHAAGLNTVRIWSCSWFGGLEWHKDYPGYHGLGHYNLKNAWRLDYLFQRCEDLGMAIDLLVQDHGAFTTLYDSNWDMNPYNQVNGGMLARTRDIMVSDEANELMSKRFRYTAARLGAFTCLLGWTAWVETETVVAKRHPANVTRRDRREITNWHRRYIPALTEFDWGRHPVSTLLWRHDTVPELWEIPEIDYLQAAAYNATDGLVNRFDRVARDLARYERPLIFEEYGGPPAGGSMASIAQSIHDGLWLGWTIPLSGSPMPWWWVFIFDHDLDRLYPQYVNFVEGVDLRNVRWRYDRDYLPRYDLMVRTRRGPDVAFAWVFPYRQVQHKYGPDPREEGEEAYAIGFAKAWERITRNCYDPIRDETPDRIPKTTPQSYSFRNMRAGSYRLEFWETWKTEAPAVSELQHAGGDLEITIPAITRDIAIKLIREAD